MEFVQVGTCDGIVWDVRSVSLFVTQNDGNAIHHFFGFQEGIQVEALVYIDVGTHHFGWGGGKKAVNRFLYDFAWPTPGCA